MDSIIKKGVETAGPKIAGVEMKLDSASVSLLSGKAALRGLLVGNPPGFKTPCAIKVGQASAVLKLSSLLGDKIVVQSAHLQAPEVTFEGSLKGNNLGRILESIRQFIAAEKSAQAKPPRRAGKRIRVDHLAVTGGVINLSATPLSGKSLRIPMPDIHLTELGKDPGGISAGELVEKLFGALFDHAVKAAAEALGQAGGEAADAAKSIGEAAAERAERSAPRIGDPPEK